MDPQQKTSHASTATSPSTAGASDSPTPQLLPPAPDSGLGRASSRSAGSAAINFFSLPSKARKEIYKRVLVVSSPLYLFQDAAGSSVETFAPDRPSRWLALLFVNRQIKSEASEILYGMNKFTFLDETLQQSGLLQAFINCSGPANAGSLSHICINFPTIEGRPENFKLREDGLQSLKLLQHSCANLRILETVISSKISSGLTRTDQNDSQFTRGALSQFDVQLKAIPSLEKIIVRVLGKMPTSSVMESLQGFGWVVQPSNRDKW